MAQPTQELFGQLRHPTVPAQAAAYLYYLARAHAFTDGNKRTALNCALIRLELHDLHLAVSQDELYELTLAVAQGQLSLEGTVHFFEDRSAAREG